MRAIHTPDWCARWALYTPDKIAIEDGYTGDTMTYAALNSCGNMLAWHLRDVFEVEKGTRVAVLAEFEPDLVTLFVAAQKSGFILVPLNYRLTPSELAWMLQNADADLFIYAPAFKEKAEAAVAGMSIITRSLADIHQTLAEHHSHPVEPFPVPTVYETDPVFILYTSGTTGYPKGAIYSRGMLEWNSINTSMSLIINQDSRTVNCMPPFHTGGWNVLLTPFLHHGGYTCLIRKFDPDRILQLLIEKRATIFMGVPTMLKMMAESAHFTHAAFPDLHYLIVGGEAMPVPLIETWHRKGVPVRQGYGLTEVGPNITSLHHSDSVRKKGSIGRPNFYVEVKVCNENGHSVSIGEKGELWLKGPMVTPGYWNNDTATAAAITDGFFRTGDIVIQDEESYLYVVDRLKNMYISGGENVYPAEVERILLMNDVILEVAVVNVPDERWGEAGFAFCVSKAEAASNETMTAFCKTRLAPFKIPRYWHWLSAIPKNDAGKIDRKYLKQQALKILQG